jgi:hypothetical protein
MSDSALQFSPQPLEYPSRRKRKAAKTAAKRTGKLRLMPTYAPPAPVRRPSGYVAAESIRMLIQDMYDGRRRYGTPCTYSAIYRELGLHTTFGCDLMRGRIKCVGTRIIDKVCSHAQMTAADLLDEITDVLE